MDNSMELDKAVLLSVLTLTVWVILALGAERRGDRRLNRPLAALLLSLCPPLAYFYTHTLDSGAVAWLGQLALACIWIKGPLLRILTGAAVNTPLHSSRWHFAPFIAASTTMILLPSALQALGIIGLLHALGYQTMSIRLLVQHRTRLTRIYRGYPNSAFYWLLFVIAGLAVVMVVDYLLMGPGLASGHLPLGLIEVSTLATTAYLLGIALCSLYRPQIFFTLENNQPPAISPAQPATTTQGGPKTRQARELTPDTATSLSAQLEQLMTAKQLYLDAELTLPLLANALGVTSHQASELLNVYIGTSFYDYINQRRLEHAAQHLSSPACQWRVIDIAYQSGFNNKNSFYRLFKQRFAMTPTAYRTAQQALPVTGQSTSIENDRELERLN